LLYLCTAHIILADVFFVFVQWRCQLGDPSISHRYLYYITEIFRMLFGWSRRPFVWSCNICIGGAMPLSWQFSYPDHQLDQVPFDYIYICIGGATSLPWHEHKWNSCVNPYNRKYLQCVTFINIWLSEMITSVGYPDVWYLAHSGLFERLTTTLIFQRTFVTSLPHKSFSFHCILFLFLF